MVDIGMNLVLLFVLVINNGLLINFGRIGRTTTNGITTVTYPCSYSLHVAVALATKPGDSDTAANRMYTLTSAYTISYFQACNNGWTNTYNGITGTYVAIGY